MCFVVGHKVPECRLVAWSSLRRDYSPMRPQLLCSYVCFSQEGTVDMAEQNKRGISGILYIRTPYLISHNHEA